MNSLTNKTIVFLLILISLNGYTQKYGFGRADTIKVFENSTELEFPWAGGLNSAQFSKIHLDNDGIEDLVIFDRTGNKILTFLNEGTGLNYSYAPEYQAQFPELNYWVLLRDYNCDGKKDICSYVSGGIGIWENTTSGSSLSFTQHQFFNPNLGTFVPHVLSDHDGNVHNLYVSKVDIPDINDVDGDGDLDVLTFGSLGSRLEYHRNMSIENGLPCDTVWVQKNQCYGHFLETGFATNTCILKDTCLSNVSNPQKNTPGGPKHTGSTVLSLDLNDDGVIDILLGDVSFTNVVGLTNDNTGMNLNTSFVSQDTTYPSNTVPVDLQIFPACFYEDINNDNIKDLIVSPNTDNEAENDESVWYYQNFGTNTNPNFSHIQNNLFQDKMIDKGTSAFPVLFDYNNDGLLDLFVSSFGKFDLSVQDHYLSQLALYENTGTAAHPQFELITEDFQNVSQAGMDKGIYPAFADMDNDGDIDVMFGDHSGYIHYFKNSSGTLNSMNLSLATPQLPDDQGSPIDVGYAAKPVLYDIDGDNDFDLIIGEENGNINFYKNNGDANNFVFRLENDNLGGIDVSEWWTTIGNSIPCLFKNDLNETQLMVGSERGLIYHYDNIDGNLSGSFNTVDTVVANIHDGLNAAPTFGDLNNDNYPELVLGNARGGLSFYIGDEDKISNLEELSEEKIIAYPNPTSGLVNFENPDGTTLRFRVFNSIGQLKHSGSTTNQIDISHLENGLYFIQFESRNKNNLIKIIKQ